MHLNYAMSDKTLALLNRVNNKYQKYVRSGTKFQHRFLLLFPKHSLFMAIFFHEPFRL